MAVGQDFLGKLRQFDAYPKTLEDFRVKTYGGAASMWNFYLISARFKSIFLFFGSHRCQQRHYCTSVPVRAHLLPLKRCKIHL